MTHKGEPMSSPFFFHFYNLQRGGKIQDPEIALKGSEI